MNPRPAPALALTDEVAARTVAERKWHAAQKAANKRPVVALATAGLVALVLGWRAIDVWGPPSVSVSAPDRYTGADAKRDIEAQKAVNDTVRDGQGRIERRIDSLDARAAAIEKAVYRIEGRLFPGTTGDGPR